MTDLIVSSDNETVSENKSGSDKTADKVILVAGFGSEYIEDLTRSIGAIK